MGGHYSRGNAWSNWVARGVVLGSYSAVNTVGNDIKRLPVAAMPQGKNAVTSFVSQWHVLPICYLMGNNFDYNGRIINILILKLSIGRGATRFIIKICSGY